ncbi:MAG: hypothetical protein KIS94_05580 [Chitinophagales bacterium]|nr:hypothetical protein [Chitinophagales bacterium]
MNPIIPDKFTVDGNLVIRFEQESLLLLAVVIVIIIIVAFLAQRFIGQI